MHNATVILKISATEYSEQYKSILMLFETPFNQIALNIRVQPIAQSVMETEGEITLILKANGTSAFSYNITIWLMDLTTSEHIRCA